MRGLSTRFIVFPENHDFELAQHQLNDALLGDGLPLVVPTQTRIDKMLNAVTNMIGSLGSVPPLQEELTLQNVAYNAVIAGCQPDHIPIVLSAVLSTLKPKFNLLGIQTTTGSATVLTLLHGPMVERLNMNAASNCLGAGNRSNAVIGRAVQLTLSNVGWAKAGITDMATIGQPAKYVAIAAEKSNVKGYVPLHVRRGYLPTENAVSVFGISGTQEIVDQTLHSPEDILITICNSIKNTGALASSLDLLGGGEQLLLLPPEVYDIFQRNGWSIPMIQEFIFEHSSMPLDWFSSSTQQLINSRIMGKKIIRVANHKDDIVIVVTGGVGIKMCYLPTWSGGTRSVSNRVQM